MKRETALMAVLLILAVAAGRAAADGEASGAAVCARCHDAEAALMVSAGGHAPGLDCLDCHADRRPGRFGARHRAIPRAR